MNPIMMPPSDEELAKELRDLLSKTHWEVSKDLSGIDWVTFL